MNTNFLKSRHTKRTNAQPVRVRKLEIEEIRQVSGGYSGVPMLRGFRL